MKGHKAVVFSILLTVVLIGVLVVLLVNGTFTKGSATVPAEPWETTLFVGFLGVLGVWALSAAAGWLTLMRRGFFAELMEKMVGYEYLGCIVGIFVLAGLWVPAVLPGPYLLWFASTRRKRPMCPQCKNWMPHGATRCAHCGALLPGAEPEPQTEAQAEPPAAVPAPETPPGPLAANTCEKCGQLKPAGAIYSFAYGTFAGSEQLDRRRTRYDFKIAGTQEVYLCDECVTATTKKRAQRITLWTTVGMVALVLGLFLCNLVMTTTNPDMTSQVDLRSGLVLFAVMLPVLFLMLRRQTRKKPLAMGDALAIQVRSPALKAQGYTRFFTREQIRDGHLL